MKSSQNLCYLRQGIHCTDMSADRSNNIPSVSCKHNQKPSRTMDLDDQQQIIDSPVFLQFSAAVWLQFGCPCRCHSRCQCILLHSQSSVLCRPPGWHLHRSVSQLHPGRTCHGASGPDWVAKHYRSSNLMLCQGGRSQEGRKMKYLPGQQGGCCRKQA